MPTYQYACTECGHAFDQFQSFSDDALTECPECQGRLRKVYNAVGVVFKGSGFYRNDSREAAKTSATSGSANGSETTSKPESKPETKTDSKKDKSSADSSSGTKSDGSSSGSSTTKTPAPA